ncbi:hypothetical protein [Vulcanisaeta thermophila]|uniref:hypothetical protein n=1 Tax=Vulcanisaeta thermophila TaxID=867917 RepID=UPI000853497F|nr:hypothetical protein [Vulcanisaeta thermophila]
MGWYLVCCILPHLSDENELFNELGNEDNAAPDKLLSNTRMRREPLTKRNIIITMMGMEISELPREP